MIEGALAGIIQGITEFLPISSSGHVALFSQLFGFKEESFHLTLALHGATLLSLLTVFRASVFSKKNFQNARMMAQAAAALSPLGLPFLFKDQMAAAFQSPSFAALGFLLTGAFLLPLFWLPRRPFAPADLTFTKALIIGAAQALAVWPGLSRSGATIAAGLFLGLSPQAAARFSFLIAAPAIALSIIAEGASGGFSAFFQGESLPRFAAALTAAYISGTLSLKALLSFVQKGWLPFFSFYVIPLGLFLFLWRI